MKKKNFEKLVGKLFKIFIVIIMSILCFAMFYSSIKYSYNYFTMNDEQICHDSNSTLINGQCHSECNRSVNDQRNMLLMGGISFPIIGVLIIVYMILVIKYKFKEK